MFSSLTQKIYSILYSVPCDKYYIYNKYIRNPLAQAFKIEIRKIWFDNNQKQDFAVYQSSITL